MERVINFGVNDSVGMRATALTPFLYRERFNRDLASDIANLQKAMKEATGDKAEQLAAADIRIFLNIAYTMAAQYAKAHGDQELPRDPMEWLDTFDGVFSIYELCPAMFELWAESSEQLSHSKKK